MRPSTTATSPRPGRDPKPLHPPPGKPRRKARLRAITTSSLKMKTTTPLQNALTTLLIFACAFLSTTRPTIAAEPVPESVNIKVIYRFEQAIKFPKGGNIADIFGMASSDSESPAFTITRVGVAHKGSDKFTEVKAAELAPQDGDVIVIYFGERSPGAAVAEKAWNLKNGRPAK